MRIVVPNKMILFFIFFTSVVLHAQEIDNSIEVKFPPEAPKTPTELLMRQWQIVDINFLEENPENDMKYTFLRYKYWQIFSDKIDLWNVNEGIKDAVFYKALVDPVQGEILIDFENHTPNMKFVIIELSGGQLKLHSEDSKIDLSLINIITE